MSVPAAGCLLAPLSWLYGGAVAVRSFLFRTGLLREHRYPTGVIAVGNLTVGGTGKTPHVEYLLRLLAGQPAAMISRGYGRRTSGLVEVTPQTRASEGGDEPVQIARKFPAVRVVVDASRREAIGHVRRTDRDDRRVIVLDDAYQHRYVRAGLNILLTDRHRLITRDRLLPLGRLREPAGARRRADIIIVTKCAPQLTPAEAGAIRAELAPGPAQRLFFTTMDYGDIYPALPGPARSLGRDLDVVLVTGIARPGPLADYVRSRVRSVEHLVFPDHHAFTTTDAARINEAFARHGSRCMVLTTEKDAVRLAQLAGLADEVRRALCVQPIEVRFLFDGFKTFNQIIQDYAGTNQRNRALD